MLRRIVAAAWIAAIISLPARAQEPPAHFALCAADSAARQFVARVRYFMATVDSGERRRLGFEAETAQGMLVVDEPVCLAAAHAYAAQARRAPPVTPPFPVSVVRVGDRYFVRPAGLSGAEADDWETALFDLGFHRLSGH